MSSDDRTGDEPAHAKYSPSSSEGWTTCLDYINANEGLPDITSEVAAEGTFAHSVSDQCVQTGMDAGDFIGQRGTVEGFSFKWDEADADFLQPGLDRVRALPGKLYGEHRVDLSKWLGDGQFGTLDRGVIGSDGYALIDLKWGRGIPVSPVEHKQTMLYSLGFWWNIGRHVSDATTFTLDIDQPRHPGGGGSWVTTLEHLLNFGEWIKGRVALTKLPNPPRTASVDGCTWCRRKIAPATEPGAVAGCKTHDAYMLDLCQQKFDDVDDAALGGGLILPSKVDVARRNTIIQNAGGIQRWLDHLYETALADAIQGFDTGILKAVDGRKSPDKWRNPAVAEYGVVDLMGEDAFNPKLKTPTQVKKAIGLEAYRTEISRYVEVGTPKPTLVPVADARPAITNHMSKMEEEE